MKEEDLHVFLGFKTCISFTHDLVLSLLARERFHSA